MDEYDLIGARIFMADNNSTSNAKKCQKTLYLTGKPAALLNTVSCFYRLC